jgi:hypothetical protein
MFSVTAVGEADAVFGVTAGVAFRALMLGADAA